jgi:single-strand DNA-binding protein
MRTQLTVTGNLTYDPTTRWTKDGVQITEFGLAHNHRRLDRSTGLWEDTEPTFYTVTCWRRLAEGVATSLHKGDPVVVYGRFATREYERNDGHVRSELKIEADAVGPDLARSIAAVNRTPRNAPAPAGDPAGGPVVAPLIAPVPDVDDEEEIDIPLDVDVSLADLAPGGNR